MCGSFFVATVGCVSFDQYWWPVVDHLMVLLGSFSRELHETLVWVARLDEEQWAVLLPVSQSSSPMFSHSARAQQCFPCTSHCSSLTTGISKRQSCGRNVFVAADLNVSSGRSAGRAHSPSSIVMFISPQVEQDCNLPRDGCQGLVGGVDGVL